MYVLSLLSLTLPLASYCPVSSLLLLVPTFFPQPQEGEPQGRHVVIVDDLVQSGGTLIECHALLSSLGAAHGEGGGIELVVGVDGLLDRWRQGCLGGSSNETAAGGGSEKAC